LAAALATKESVDAQQAFHDARELWALKNFEPVRDEYNKAVAARDGLKAKMDAAEGAFERARAACKERAFDKAIDNSAEREAQKKAIAEA